MFHGFFHRVKPRFVCSFHVGQAHLYWFCNYIHLLLALYPSFLVLSAFFVGEIPHLLTSEPVLIVEFSIFFGCFQHL